MLFRSTANAIFQALFQFGLVAGPALAGLLLAGAGVRFVYWLDVAGFGVALFAVSLISPQPVREPGHRPGLRSVMEGLRYVRGKQAIEGAYLIDINAMVFGMPRALFPALAASVFGGGASTLGFLYAAPGAAYRNPSVAAPPPNRITASAGNSARGMPNTMALMSIRYAPSMACLPRT